MGVLQCASGLTHILLKILCRLSLSIMDQILAIVFVTYFAANAGKISAKHLFKHSVVKNIQPLWGCGFPTW